jgi:hypothetical protein
LLTRYIKNARDYDLEMEERRINRFVGYDAREYQCRILRGDLGLRKLGLIK